ncbi:hypothetical protein BC940DRAFT_330691 [Gongronella butleri]|nr:hypothetical protein BC940DRAFT_330691 [Gongronella butleri]
MLKVLVGCVLSLFLLAVDAVAVQGTVETNSLLTDLRQVRSSTTVSLSGMYSTLVRADGSFTFEHVEPGSYLLQVDSIDFIFPKLRVDITQDGQITGAYTGLGQGWDKTGYGVPYPFALRAKAHADYFLAKQSFNMLAMFKNPMFLMIGFSGIMMFVMPRMLKNMDPDVLKEITDSQEGAAQMPSLSQMFSQAQSQAQQQRSSKR